MIRLLLISLMSLTAACAQASSEHIELGTVNWGRDYPAALKESTASGKPVLILFQEVPG